MASTEMETTVPAGEMQEAIGVDQGGDAAVTASKHNNKRKEPPPSTSTLFETVSKSTITYKSDIKSKSKRNGNICGILHYINKLTRERIHHTFIWLADKNDEEGVQNVIERLRDGEDNNNDDDNEMVFIPYSSLDNWISRYPHAYPSIECDANGTIREITKPFAFSSTAKSRPNNNKKQKRSSSQANKLIPNGNLPNLERSQLHIEIYNYFNWLHDELSTLETKSASTVRRAGISIPGVDNLMSKLENTFRDVGEYKKMKKRDDVDEEEEDETVNNDARSMNEMNNSKLPAKQLPMLENCLGSDLRSVVEEAQQKKEGKDTNTQLLGEGSNTLKQKKVAVRDFESLFSRLVAFKEEFGHVNVPQKFNDAMLGRWLGDLRRRKRELLASGLEWERPDTDIFTRSPSTEIITLPISSGRLGIALTFVEQIGNPPMSGAVISGIEEESALKEHVTIGDWLMSIDGNPVSKLEDLEVGKDKDVRMFKIAKKKPYHCTYLSAERLERLDSIGIKWNVQKVSVKSWDERFNLLKEFKETRGHWPSRKEKWNGIGDWINNQRKSYKQKNQKFMTNRAPRLDEIGFPWVLQKNTPVPWEDSFQRLVEFGRVNRHFDVPRPELSTDDPEASEAMRFYKWVQSLHKGYKAYLDGKQSILNEERVNKLLGLGFEFKEEVRTKAKRAAVPEIPFEDRVEQLNKFHGEFGHLNIDPRHDGWNNFGGWCAQVSQQYRDWVDGKEAITPLMEQQFQQLSEMGFDFTYIAPDARERRTWQENFDAFLEFQKTFGHGNVPSKYKLDRRLGVWVKCQKMDYKLRCEGKQSKMTQEKYDKLQSVGFPFDAEGEN